jgi:hypothetical protein
MLRSTSDPAYLGQVNIRLAYPARILNPSRGRRCCQPKRSALAMAPANLQSGPVLLFRYGQNMKQKSMVAIVTKSRFVFPEGRIKQDQRPAHLPSSQKETSRQKQGGARQDCLAVSDTRRHPCSSRIAISNTGKCGKPVLLHLRSLSPHAPQSSLLPCYSLSINIFCKSSSVWSCHFLVQCFLNSSSQSCHCQ